jgi:hypothetical protein
MYSNDHKKETYFCRNFDNQKIYNDIFGDISFDEKIKFKIGDKKLLDEYKQYLLKQKY